MARKFYLEDIPLEEAWRRFREALENAGFWQALPGEDVPRTGTWPGDGKARVGRPLLSWVPRQRYGRVRRPRG